MKILEQGGGASSATGARARITIISPGQGSSGYYPPETIAEAVELFAPGTHMYLDHATESERAERGVRSLEKLVGVIESAPTLSPSGALLADVKIMPQWREFIKEAYPYIGVSIAAEGEIDTDGNITRLTAVESVDFVTKAGRGGKVEAILESALPPNNPTPKEEPVSVITLTESEHKDLLEAAEKGSKVAQLEKQIADLQAELEKEKAKAAVAESEAVAAKESAVRAEAGVILEEAFAGIEAPVGKTRLLEAVNPNEFDAETFRVTVTEAAAEYAPSVSPVHGVGKTAPTAAVTVTEAEIAKEFGDRI